MFLKVFGSLVLGIMASQAYAIQFHYDSLGRLIKSQRPKEENAALMQVYYGHDAASNIVKVTNEPEGKLPSGVTLSFQQKTTPNFSQLALQWQTSVGAPGIFYDLYFPENLRLIQRVIEGDSRTPLAIIIIAILNAWYFFWGAGGVSLTVYSLMF